MLGNPINEDSPYNIKFKLIKDLCASLKNRKTLNSDGYICVQCGERKKENECKSCYSNDYVVPFFADVDLLFNSELIEIVNELGKVNKSGI